MFSSSSEPGLLRTRAEIEKLRKAGALSGPRRTEDTSSGAQYVGSRLRIQVGFRFKRSD